jgi:antirestriction protein
MKPLVLKAFQRKRKKRAFALPPPIDATCLPCFYRYKRCDYGDANMNTEAPAVYVGTYAKYNAGSIKGAWLKLEDYADREDFLAACADLHKDESDPELMFYDFQCFPKAFYGESYIDAALWDWLALDEHDRELLAVYQDHIDESGTIDEAREAFCGNGYRTEADWAEEWLDTEGLEVVPRHLKGYIDYAAYARDCRGDFTFARSGGELWVFANH